VLVHAPTIWRIVDEILCKMLSDDTLRLWCAHALNAQAASFERPEVETRAGDVDCDTSADVAIPAGLLGCHPLCDHRVGPIP
jgi:hypothetical protein